MSLSACKLTVADTRRFITVYECTLLQVYKPFVAMMVCTEHHENAPVVLSAITYEGCLKGTIHLEKLVSGAEAHYFMFTTLWQI